MVSTLRRKAAAATMVATIALLMPASGEAQTAMRKAGRGLAAMTCSFLEVPGNMVAGARRTEDVGGVALGFAQGLGMIVVRTLVGVYEYLTCPIPAPANFEPILEPEFPWEHFETNPTNLSTGPRRA